MKTLVIGANGKIGRHFCRGAASTGRPVRAMVRQQEHAEAMEAMGVESVVADLEDDFAHAFDGCDRVVFTAGSGGATGGDKTLLVDLYGAIRAIDESLSRGALHFVMVSAMRADQPLASPPALRHYMVAKKLADEHLLRSSLPHTILRPGRLSDEPASGAVRTEVSGGGFDISRENVALCIAAALDQPGARGRVVDLLDGDTAIDSLFAA